MLNKPANYITFFIGGSLSGVSFFSSILIPFLILGHYILIKGLFCKDRKINSLFSGWLFGAGFFFTSMHWIVNPFLVYEEHKILAPLVLIIFPSLMGLFFAIPCVLINKLINFQKINEFFFTKTLSISFLIFTSELLRSNIFGGLPFNLYAHLWIFNENFIKISSFIGVFGLSFLTILWIVTTVLYLTRKDRSFIIPLILFPIVLVSFSVFPLEENQPESESKTISVRVVQPNIPQNKKWDRTLFQEHLDKMLTLSNKVNKEELLVVWPEAAITDFLNENEDLISYIKQNIDENTIIITGGLRREFYGGDFKVFNSFYIIKKDDLIFYDKKKLVPFGEFIPFRFLFNIFKLTPGKTDFSRGDMDEILFLELEKGKIYLEPSICYEAIFQTFNNRKIELLVNITNDAWFGNFTGPKQHLTASIFRSVEKGVPLVRSANSGISVITNKNGKTLKRLELNTSGFIDHELNLGKSETFFMTHKNTILIYLILVILFIYTLTDFLIKKRKDLKVL